MSSEGLDRYLDGFVVESQEQLAAAEARLMAMEVARVRGEAPDADDLDAVFRAVHSVKGTAGFLELDHIVAVLHEAESLLDLAREGRLDLTAARVTALCGALDFTAAAVAEVEASGSDAALAEAAGVAIDTLADAVAPVEDEPGEPAVVHFPLDDAEAVGTLGTEVSLVDEVVPADPTPTPAPTAPPAPRVAAPVELPERPATPSSRGSIRVDVDKLDALMNLVGELILAETMVTRSQDLQGLELPHFTKAARDLDRITRSLQDIAMSVRMVPVGATFQRMHRLVRDLAGRQDKQVELVVAGEQTEIDKNLVERIADPLVHLMRNAIDHGLETPEAREAVGKPAVGTLHLSAAHQSGEVWITVADDGRGLDRQAIVDRALERGLVDTAEGLDDRRILDLLFHPGFSTASEVTDVSGRGVGLDVVRRDIEAISGRVDLESRPGHGTTITLKIPLTLAIIDGMLVRVGSRTWTLPVLSIRQSLQGRDGKVTRLPDGREVVNVRGEVLPLLRVGRLFGEDDADIAVQDGILVLCLHAGRTLALLVDALLGQRQTVIQALPPWLGRRAGFSGCSILANGEISLIVDLGALEARSRRDAPTVPNHLEACA